MMPAELQRALAATPYRSAQVLMYRLVEGKSRDECAALYGITPGAWDVLFLRSVQDFEREGLGRAVGTPADEQQAAADLSAALTPELSALEAQREAVRALIAKAEDEAERSPERARENWLRRLAIAAIIALTVYFWLKQRAEPEKPVPYAPYLTEPKRQR